MATKKTGLSASGSVRPPNQKLKEVNPDHYKINVKTTDGREVELEVVDLIEALCPEDAHMAHAFTYLLRAGRKKTSSYVSDVAKCAWWCLRAVRFHGGHPEVEQ